MRILIADDSKTSLALLESSLKKLGHEVIAANSGKKAIAEFQKQRPDLIILDVMMEGMNGFDTAKEIRKSDDQNWIPIIFLSASVDDKSIEAGIDAGGDDYLTKPFSEVTLAAKIKAMQRIAEMRAKLIETTEELRFLTSTDPLTQVYNRFQFEKSLIERMAEADRHSFGMALLFIDIDHFKTINDSLGHHIGDLLLIEVATRIKKIIRAEDFVARLGGDEFVVMLSHIHNAKEAGEIAQKIIASIATVYHLENNTIRISASIGVACYPLHDTDKSSLVQNADIAMYHAKEIGRNNFQYFSSEIKEQYKQHINLERELKFALERNQLFVLYQPIVNLLTKRMIGMEALLRWQHPEYGIISPNIFIPIAEESGLIVQMGHWVTEQVCQQGFQWYEAGHRDFRLSVNISLQQFLQENFFESITTIINKTKWPANMLELELTETTVIAYTSFLRDTIKKLRDLGIGIAIDDFGTRYSSLTGLRFLPITTLKIDKMFLQDVETDPKNSIIVKSLIALGSNLHLNVIAEGVQTEEQQQFLVVNGCFHGQGFLISKPLTAEEMTEYLRAQSQNQPISTS